MNLRLLVKCSTNWVIKPTGSFSFCGIHGARKTMHVLWVDIVAGSYLYSVPDVSSTLTYVAIVEFRRFYQSYSFKPN